MILYLFRVLLRMIILGRIFFFLLGGYLNCRVALIWWRRRLVVQRLGIALLVNRIFFNDILGGPLELLEIDSVFLGFDFIQFLLLAVRMFPVWSRKRACVELLSLTNIIERSAVPYLLGKLLELLMLEQPKHQLFAVLVWLLELIELEYGFLPN